MRISDWSSDVCSSDLVLQEELRLKPLLQEVHGNRKASERVVEADLALHADLVRRYAPLEEVGQLLHVLQLHERERVARVEVFQIGRASCRGKSVSVRVDLGGRRIFKQKK